MGQAMMAYCQPVKYLEKQDKDHQHEKNNETDHQHEKNNEEDHSLVKAKRCYNETEHQRKKQRRR